MEVIEIEEGSGSEGFEFDVHNVYGEENPNKCFVLTIFDPSIRHMLEFNPNERIITNVHKRIPNVVNSSMNPKVKEAVLEVNKQLQIKEYLNGFKIEESFFARKRQFPTHSISRGACVFQDKVTRRIPIKEGFLDLFVNYKSLNIRDREDDDPMLALLEKVNVNSSVNELITDTLRLLYKKYDKQLILNPTKEEVLILKERDLESYMIGEDLLFCYNSVVNALYLHYRLELELIFTTKEDISSGYYPYFESKITSMLPNSGRKAASKLFNLKKLGKRRLNTILFWYFPVASIKSSHTPAITETSTILDGTAFAYTIKTTLDICNNPIPNLMRFVIPSSELRIPIIITVLKINNVGSLSQADFIRGMNSSKNSNFGKTKLVYLLGDKAGVSFSAKQDYNMNIQEFTRSLQTENKLPKGKIVDIPVLLKVRFTVMHGRKQTTRTEEIQMQFSNNSFANRVLSFPNLLINSLAPESYLSIVVGVVYSSGKVIDNICFCNISLFDSNGFLLVGKNVSNVLNIEFQTLELQ